MHCWALKWAGGYHSKLFDREVWTRILPTLLCAKPNPDAISISSPYKLSELPKASHELLEKQHLQNQSTAHHNHHSKIFYTDRTIPRNPISWKPEGLAVPFRLSTHLMFEENPWAATAASVRSIRTAPLGSRMGDRTAFAQESMSDEESEGGEDEDATGAVFDAMKHKGKLLKQMRTMYSGIKTAPTERVIRGWMRHKDIVWLYERADRLGLHIGTYVGGSRGETLTSVVTRTESQFEALTQGLGKLFPREDLLDAGRYQAIRERIMDVALSVPIHEDAAATARPLNMAQLHNALQSMRRLGPDRLLLTGRYKRQEYDRMYQFASHFKVHMYVCEPPNSKGVLNVLVSRWPTEEVDLMKYGRLMPREEVLDRGAAFHSTAEANTEPRKTEVIQELDKNVAHAAMTKMALMRKGAVREKILKGNLPAADYKWLYSAAAKLKLHVKTFKSTSEDKLLTSIISVRAIENGDGRFGGEEVPFEDLEVFGGEIESFSYDMNAFQKALEEFKGSTEKELKITWMKDGKAKKNMVLERAKDLVAEQSLFLKVYGSDHAPVVIVARHPLPDYRPEFDPKLRTLFDVELTTESRQLATQRLRLLPRLEEEDNKSTLPLAGVSQAHLVLDDVEEEDTSEEEGGESVDVAHVDAENETRASREEQQKVARAERQASALSSQLKRKQEIAQTTPAVKASLAKRMELPACKMREEVARLLATSQVLLISGETGCGKSTQVPQMILEDAIRDSMGGSTNIVVTQPRRISAISLARRVANERGESAGDVVGYKVRGDSKVSGSTRLMFCTTGVLLRRLINDPLLEGVSHIVVDEIHERKMNEDFLLIILQSLLKRRSDLKLILMSATLNAEAFQAYFGGCPRLHIPGFTYPVTQYFLEDVFEQTGFRMPTETEAVQMEKAALSGGRDGSSARRLRMQEAARGGLTERDWHLGFTLDAEKYKSYSESTRESLHTWMSYKQEQIHLLLVAATVEHIAATQPEGAILVFLTGWDEIVKLKEMMAQHRHMGNTSQVSILPLHSSLPTDQQQEIFNPPPPGVRKVVLATNIAETSITIPDVVYVVDAGKAKEKSYDVVNNLATLLPGWVSKASVRQRRGRAGRVQPGVAYHLFPRTMAEEHFVDHETPELLRTPLGELCLQIKFLGLGDPRDFLAKALNPPEPAAVSNALELLQEIGALDAKGELTPLGSQLALLPVDPSLGKMIVVGAACGVLDPVLTIASSMSTRDVFIRPMENKNIARTTKINLGAEDRSDHIAALRAFEGWRAAKSVDDSSAMRYCIENFISSQAMQLISDLRLQFAELLRDAGFLDLLVKGTGDTQDESPKWSRGRGGRSDAALEALIKRASTAADDRQLLKGVMVAGMYPNLVHVRQMRGRDEKVKGWKFSTLQDGSVSLHPGSVNDVLKAKKEDSIWFDHQWLVYSEKIKTSSLYIRYSTLVNDLALLLFGGKLEQRDAGYGDVHLCLAGDFIKFKMKREEANIIMKMRAHLTHHIDDLLAGRASPPLPPSQASDEFWGDSGNGVGRFDSQQSRKTLDPWLEDEPEYSGWDDMFAPHASHGQVIDLIRQLLDLERFRVVYPKPRSSSVAARAHAASTSQAGQAAQKYATEEEEDEDSEEEADDDWT